MKLSIQHLRRAFMDSGAPHGPGAGKFAGMFERITTTLIEQVDALARIANEFSTFARLPRQILEPLDLNAVIREAVALMQEQESATITQQLSPGPLVIQGDREELRRIYINLIKNAIEATQEGRENRIEVTSEQGDFDGVPVALSRVSDTGAGIPDSLRERIFVPNFSTKTSGTGLGLAIVRKSVEDMRGQISFETTPGEGTTFLMTWPLLSSD